MFIDEYYVIYFKVPFNGSKVHNVPFGMSGLTFVHPTEKFFCFSTLIVLHERKCNYAIHAYQETARTVDLDPTLKKVSWNCISMSHLICNFVGL